MKEVLEKLKNKKLETEQLYKKLEEEILTKRQRLELLRKMKNVINRAIIVGSETIQKIIEDIVSEGIQIVYDNKNIFFVIEKTNISGKPGLVFKIKKDNCSRNLLCYGGGIRNIVSTVLRFVVANYLNPGFIFVLDEVGSNISKEYQANFGALLKIFSRKFNHQIILITHQPRITEFADKIITVELKGDTSYVKEGL